MDFAKTIAGLRTEIETLTGTNGTLTAALKEANGKVEAGVSKITELGTKVSTLEGQVQTLTAERDALKPKAEKTETAIQQEVIERVGSAGVPAIVRVPGAEGKEPGGSTNTTTGLTGLARAMAAHTTATEGKPGYSQK